MDRNKTPLTVHIDLSKAFDTIDHEILLNKLKFYGIKNQAIKLLENYLSARQQFVEFENVCSDYELITTGVPQGSILGPLLFIIYINDISASSKYFYPIIYADDTTLTATLNIFHNNENMMNDELNKIVDWFNLNKLSLNPNKTKAMLFYPKQKIVNPPSLKINEDIIEFVENFNFLGIVIDRHLNWNVHVQTIQKKIAKTVGVMSRLKHVVPHNVLKTLYNSLIFPYLNYGILAWGTWAHKLFTLQKKAIRIITNSKYNAHTDPLFKALKILKVKDICTHQEYKFLFKFHNKTLPWYFCHEMITVHSQLHSYDTRGAQNFQLPMIRHTFVKTCLRYRISIINNSCPSIIKEKIVTHSIQGFNKYIKFYFIDSYNFICRNDQCYVCAVSEH